jgi:hypothetical protein
MMKLLFTMTMTAAALLIVTSGVRSAKAADSGWTLTFSEEGGGPWRYCGLDDNAERVERVQTTGSNGDNHSLYCGDTVTNSSYYYPANFSDETAGGRECISGGVWGHITGMRCTSDFCDNMFLECGVLSSSSLSGCAWTGWVSEEGGGLNNWNKSARAAQCSGAYCDSMRFLACNGG